VCFMPMAVMKPRRVSSCWRKEEEADAAAGVLFLGVRAMVELNLWWFGDYDIALY
jgi:hypothetical protein